jgi:signal transduction histidine kinase
MSLKKWLIPKPFDWVSTLLYLSVLLLYFYYRTPLMACGCGGNAELGGAMVFLTFCLLGIDRVEYWRYGERSPRGVAIGLLALRLLLIEFVSRIDGFRFSSFLYLVPPYIAFQALSNTLSWGFTGFVWLLHFSKLVTFHPSWYKDADSVNSLIIFSLGLLFVITMARVVLKEIETRTHTEKLLRDLEISHQQLAAYAAEVAQLATVEERNRLAREIHDSLGHHLTVINILLEKALAFRVKKPDEADLAVRDAKRIASEALQDTRQSVSTLRSSSESFSLARSLRDLVSRTRSDHVAIDLVMQGNESGFSKQVLITLFRAAQEGLTNIQKHAGATHVTLRLDLNTEDAELAIIDDGCGFDSGLLGRLEPDRQGGYGLQGLGERLELVGGVLSIDSQPGRGTTLHIHVPREALLKQGLAL